MENLARQRLAEVKRKQEEQVKPELDLQPAFEKAAPKPVKHEVTQISDNERKQLRSEVFGAIQQQRRGHPMRGRRVRWSKDD